MTEKQLKALGKLLAETRTKQGLSFRQLGEMAGVDSAWILRIERAEYPEMSPYKLAAVVDSLGLNAERVDRLTGGYLRETLPSSRVYFRARYNLTPEQTEQIEAEITQLKQKKKK